MKSIKRYFYFILIVLLFSGTAFNYAFSEDGVPVSPRIIERGEELDRQIVQINQRISDLVINTDLISSDIQILPYQSSYRTFDNRIELETHSFIRDDIYNNKIVGINRNITTIHLGGGSVTGIDIILYENNHVSGDTTIVKISDPSPLTDTTDDITFTHIRNAQMQRDEDGIYQFTGRVLIDERPLGEIRNNDASPLRNQIKSDFLMDNLTSLYDNVLFISQAFINSTGGSDQYMAEFMLDFRGEH